MNFDTKIAIVVAEDLAIWQKLNVTAFLTSGIVGTTEGIIGEPYKDGSQRAYLPLCIQPIIVLKTSRGRLQTILNRANSQEVAAAIYIEDMFATGHDAANRATVTNYPSGTLPLVGLAVRGEKKLIDKIVKGAKLHD
ncbi:MAG: DUF2000 family protein [Ardenticatenaceae bacterium]|nr:DUF2000 family protein [Ardenticatenaceae bacterium]